jgi:cardiolipin synthase
MNIRNRASKRLVSVPNALSALRLATVPVFVWLFLSGHENAAVVLYGVAAGTDFLDGYVARRTGAVTEVGKLLDPLADRVFIIALAMALVARGALPVWLAVVVVGRDLVVLAIWPLLEARRVGRIPVSKVGKVATALLLVGLTALAASETTFWVAGLGRPLGLAGTVLGGFAYWAAAALYAREVSVRLRMPQGREMP